MICFFYESFSASLCFDFLYREEQFVFQSFKLQLLCFSEMFLDLFSATSRLFDRLFTKTFLRKLFRIRNVCKRLKYLLNQYKYKVVRTFKEDSLQLFRTSSSLDYSPILGAICLWACFLKLRKQFNTGFSPSQQQQQLTSLGFKLLELLS